MKKFTCFLVMIVSFLSLGVGVFAATVGNSLPAPETGWVRIDDRDLNLTYTGSWSQFPYPSGYNGTTTYTSQVNATVKFNFTGSKIRIISLGESGSPTLVNIQIDNNPIESFSLQKTNGGIDTLLAYEKQGLDFKEHFVEITAMQNGNTHVDAIDIDDSGTIKPYNDAPINPSDAPSNLIATAGNGYVSLSWNVATGTTTYNVKRSTATGGPYTLIATNIATTTYTDNSVTNGNVYYYTVTGIMSGVEGLPSIEASATPSAPEQPSGDMGLLVIMMTNGMEKEYEMTSPEILNFINWYQGRSSGYGSPYYQIDKSYNLGPFISRMDYIIYDKILCFEIMKYNQ